MGKNTRPSGIPSESEIVAALDNSGYPLEVRTFEKLRTSDFSLSLNYRTRVDGTSLETREIDLLATKDVVYGPRAELAYAAMQAHIQMKTIREGVFVGFLASHQPTAGELRDDRTSRVAGLPSSGIIPGKEIAGAILSGRDSIACAFDSLNDAPYCVQWGLAKRDRNGEVRIDQEHGTWDAIANTVRGCTWQGEDITQRLFHDAKPTPLPQLYFQFPTLVVDAPLWTYQVAQRSLKEVDWFIVSVEIDTYVGPVRSLVDVVAETALDKFMDRYDACAKLLEARLVALNPQLVDAANKQRGHASDVAAILAMNRQLQQSTNPGRI